MGDLTRSNIQLGPSCIFLFQDACSSSLLAKKTLNEGLVMTVMYIIADQAGICQISHEVHEESVCWTWNSRWWSWRRRADSSRRKVRLPSSPGKITSILFVHQAVTVLLMLVTLLMRQLFLAVCRWIWCGNDESVPRIERQSEIVPCSLPKPAATETHMPVYGLLICSKLSSRIATGFLSFCKNRISCMWIQWQQRFHVHIYSWVH